MWFPSFLTSLPTLPSISLPANIQRRFLSYVLKRALGRFVLASGLDVERIQAQISQGWVELERLEVNVEEINALIPEGLPFTVTSGEVAKVTARVPFPNLWSDPLALTVDSLTLEVVINPPAKGKATGAPPHRGGWSSANLDLAGSVTSAADDFVHDELDAFEGAELDRSIRESLILSHSDPFADRVPGLFPASFPEDAPDVAPLAQHPVESTTALASLVERILARLECRVRNVRLRVRYEDDARGGIIELRLGEVRYADETPHETTEPRKTVRVITVSSAAVFVLPIPPAQPPQPESPSGLRFGNIPTLLTRSTSADSSSSFSTDSTDSTDSSADDYHDYNNMVMSQAVADLRQSTVADLAQTTPAQMRQSTMSTASGQSIYHSVYQSAHQSAFQSAHQSAYQSAYQSTYGDPEAEPQSATPPTAPPLDRSVPPPDPFAADVTEEEAAPSPATESPPAGASSRGTSRSATPTARSEPPETLLLSFGSEDIVLRMTTTHPSILFPPVERRQSGDSAPLPQRSTEPPVRQLAALDIDFSFGTISAVLLPSHTALILSLAQAALGGHPPAPQSPKSPHSSPPSSTSQPRFDARVHVKGIHFALVYDINPPSDDFHSTLQQYFARPASTYLPIGHLRLRLEDIGVSYSQPSFSSAPQTLPRKRPDPRRKSSTSAKPTVVSITVADVSLFEYLANAETGEDEPPGGAFPVLIFDANLPKQYEVPPGAPSSLLSTQPRTPTGITNFPEFDSVDWRNASVQKRSGDKVWRVKPRGKGILRGTGPTPEPTAPAVTVRKELSGSEPASIDFVPVHVFLDLSLVERLLPVLRTLAPVIQSKSDTIPIPTPVTPLGRPPLALRTSDVGLDHRIPRRPSTSSPATLLTLRCPMIRLDIRCPAPLNRRGSWGDGAHLRSGIVTLDIHGLGVTVADDPAPVGPPGRRASIGTFEPPPSGGIHIEWQKMVFLFSRVPEKRSSAFLVIGPLAPDPGDEEGVLLPTVHVHSEIAPLSGLKTKSVTCRIPSVQAKIRQPTVEGLQFFADDMTHWLDGAFGDGSAPRPRDDLKMIGSRFFGSKASSSASSSAADEEEDDPGATLLRVFVSETEVTLLVPKLAGVKAASPDVPERILSLRASDIDIKLESNATDKQETSLTLMAMDADMFHHAEPGASPHRIFGRTTPLTLTTHTQPLINFRFSSITHADRTKETGIRVTTNACSVFVTKDLEWIHDLALYAKTPEGVFEDVVPSEVTRIQLLVNDCSVHIAAPTMPGALVAVANVMEVRTIMESEAVDNTIDVGISGIHLLAIDDLAAASPLQMGYPMSLDAWKKAGYAPLVELVALDLQVLRSHVPQETILLDVLHGNVRVTVCADSLATLGGLAGDMGNLVSSKEPPKPPARRQMTLDQTIDVFQSVDLDAFGAHGRAPDIVSGADMIEDDLPTNLDYLDHAARQSGAMGIDQLTGESLRSWETPDDAPHISTTENGATIKILMPEPFDEEPNYWDNLPVLKNGDETRMGKLRVRVQNFSASVFLHDGYDWQRTRKAIEDEIKAVRKRLEKIKQLLAEGQKPDASIERPSSVLFNSVYIGLDHNQDDMDSAQLIAAIDEELEDLGAMDAATQSSWQSFSEVGPLPSPRAATAAAASRKSHVRLRGKRLTRSKKGQIEFSLMGLRADVDVYGPEDETSKRVHVTARSFEIFDHIKTSTWKKFLTEMKSDSRGNVRETDADMVRVELVWVRPSLPSPDEEIRVRAKILPLRLHVDQDALDFLKHFFSFTPPGAEVVVEESPKTEPFFQHVEIFPVELKLDYKPKRVDYAALRAGRTIELMNFFHFDGAEMTLRHVTLSGVTGSTRLSDMLQDIWTPDVKANQLADVISGVSPIRSMVNVGSGVADLILLPIEQYRKDGRLARGVQRGTNSFVKSTGLEMMKLGARLATGTQVVLEHAEGVLGKQMGDSVVLETTAEDASSDDEAEAQSRYANQPGNVREGVKAAYQSLSSNINSAAQTILAVPMETYERSGEDGPLKAVVRAVPIAVLKPMIGASEAVSKTLWGLRNSLDPEGRREMGDKYK